MWHILMKIFKNYFTLQNPQFQNTWPSHSPIWYWKSETHEKARLPEGESTVFPWLTWVSYQSTIWHHPQWRCNQSLGLKLLTKPYGYWDSIMANIYCISWSEEWIAMVVCIACICFGIYRYASELGDAWDFLDLK